MTDPADEAVSTEPGSAARAPRMPRWVKVFVVIGAVLVVFVVLRLAGIGGNHGPGRHQGGAPASVPSPALATALAVGPQELWSSHAKG